MLKKELFEIEDFREYMSALKEASKTCMIIITVKNTVGAFFYNEDKDALKKLGITEEFWGKRWSSYIGIINRGEIIHSKASKKDQQVKTMIENHRISVWSEVTTEKGHASIYIDKVNYAVNNRGFNIVVYDYSNNCVIDSVCFDMNIDSRICYRPSNVAYLRGEIVKNRREIEELQKLVSVHDKKTEYMLMEILKRMSYEGEDIRKTIFRSIPQARGQKRKVQQISTLILEKFDEVCRKYEIPYFLHFGTLIGAIRHGGCIPWDDDIDVAMLREDIEKLKSVMDDEVIYIDDVIGPWRNRNIRVKLKCEDAPYFVDIWVLEYSRCRPEDGQKALEMKRALHTEMIRYDDADKDLYQEHCRAMLNKYIEIFKKEFQVCNKEEAEYILWAIDNGFQETANRKYYQVSDIFPLREMEFEGRMYWVPQKAEELMNKNYNDGLYEFPRDMTSYEHFREDIYTESSIDKLIKKYK